MSVPTSLAVTALAASITFFAVSQRQGVRSVRRGVGGFAKRVERRGQKTGRRRGNVNLNAAANNNTNAGGDVITVPGSIPGARVPDPVSDPRLTNHPDGKVKVALCQVVVGDDKLENIETMVSAVRHAARAGASLVVLPEMWNCPYANTSFPKYAEVIPPVQRWGESSESKESSPIDDDVKSKSKLEFESASPSVTAVAAVAKETGVVLVAGSIPERDALDADTLYNTCLVIDGDGKIIAKHRKTHLFDLDIPGEVYFKESDTLTRGSELTVVDTACGRLGIGICFDMRFPELASVCCARGASVLIYPGAFNQVTGPLHWELLQKARAVDNQCFVLTCSPALDQDALSKDPPGYQAHGHSSAIGPFAETLGTCGDTPTTGTCWGFPKSRHAVYRPWSSGLLVRFTGTCTTTYITSRLFAHTVHPYSRLTFLSLHSVFAELDFREIVRRRKNMPLQTQRRGDLYAIVDRTNTRLRGDKC